MRLGMDYIPKDACTMRRLGHVLGHSRHVSPRLSRKSAAQNTCYESTLRDTVCLRASASNVGICSKGLRLISLG